MGKRQTIAEVRKERDELAARVATLERENGLLRATVDAIFRLVYAALDLMTSQYDKSSAYPQDTFGDFVVLRDTLVSAMRRTARGEAPAEEMPFVHHDNWGGIRLQFPEVPTDESGYPTWYWRPPMDDDGNLIIESRQQRRKRERAEEATEEAKEREKKR